MRQISWKNFLTFQNSAVCLTASNFFWRVCNKTLTKTNTMVVFGTTRWSTANYMSKLKMTVRSVHELNILNIHYVDHEGEEWELDPTFKTSVIVFKIVNSNRFWDKIRKTHRMMNLDFSLIKTLECEVAKVEGIYAAKMNTRVSIKILGILLSWNVSVLDTFLVFHWKQFAVYSRIFVSFGPTLWRIMTICWRKYCFGTSYLGCDTK